jgi:DNA-binding GntR family transcriptional regulator
VATLKRPETLTGAVARHVRDAIVRGEYAAGSALPEIRLAEELGTSRGTVREALRTLEDQGLVEILPHKGTFVSSLSKRRAREVYELRSLLEGYAVRIAVERGAFAGSGRAALLERLKALQVAAATDDAMAVIEAERALHREIWSRCDHGLLLDYLANLQLQTRRLLIYSRAFSTPPAEEYEVHRGLVDAILAGDAAAAEDAMRAHVNESADIVLPAMPEDPDEDGASPRDRRPAQRR